jgi:hypothetical protein
LHSRCPREGRFRGERALRLHGVRRQAVRQSPLFFTTENP